MKKIKRYRLPIIVRLGRHYNLIKYIISSSIALTISLIILLTARFNIAEIIVFTISCLVFIYSFLQLSREAIYKASFLSWKHNQERTPNHFGINSGPPGTGKTLDATASGYYMSKWSWEELQFDYWLIYSHIKDRGHIPNEDEKEIIEAYNFFIENQGIPCLTSNYPIKSLEYNRYSYRLEPELLNQQQRSPYRNCLLVDEIGTIENMELYKDRESNAGGAADMSDMNKFIRQFFEGRAIGTEQEATNVFKDTRRVVAIIKRFNKTRLVMKPVFLSWLYEFLKKRFIKRMRTSDCLVFSRFMRRFKEFLSQCGFFKLEYTVLVGDQTSDDGNVVYKEESGRNGKPFKYYLPCALPFRYNSRVFRSAYRAIDKAIALSVYDSLSLVKTDSQKMLKAVTLERLNRDREKRKSELKRSEYLEHQRLKEEYKASRGKKTDG